MTSRRLPLLAVLVVGCVAVVALVAHGRPLAASTGGGGVSSSFWSYVLTTTVIVLAVGGVLMVVTLLDTGATFTKPQSSWADTLIRTLLGLMALAAVIVYIVRHHPHGFRLHQQGSGATTSQGNTVPTVTGVKKASGAHVVWLEVLIVFGLVAVSIAVAMALGRRNRTTLPELPVAPEAVAEALDESIDDLRSDPDLRRAIVAAYARMEQALRVSGLPRRPAEAPLEYLERALGTLDTSGPAVRRLTELFEWAKFSHHEPEPSMRDEAIEALVAVRDELRAPAAVDA